MSEIMVKLRMPAIKRAFKASFSEVERPTGVQTALLLHIGSEATRKMRLGEAMGKMGIHTDLVERIMIPAIKDMTDAGMINGPVPTIDTSLSNYDFTAVGRQAFENGSITTRVEPFHGEVVYRPGSVDHKYSIYKREGFTVVDSPGREFEGLEADIQRIENEVTRNKKQYGVPNDAEVFNLEVDGPEERLHYNSSLNLVLDEANGEMRISGGNLDTNFIKSAFTAEDILEGISPGIFSPRSDSIRVLSWKEWTEGMSGAFMLPWDLSVDSRRSVVLNDPGTCTVEGSIPIADGLGADVIVIESSGIAREYLMVDRMTSVTGFEGSKRLHLVIRKMVDKDRIALLVEKALGTFSSPGSIADLREVVRVSVLLPDKSRANSLVAEYIRKNSDPVNTMKEVFKEFGTEAWFKAAVDTILEEVLVGRGSAEVRSILMRLNRTIVGHNVADYCLRSESDPLVVMDNLGGVLTTRNLARRCGEGLDARIVSGDIPDLTSTRLVAATRASRILGDLRAGLAISSYTDSIDYEKLYESKEFSKMCKDIDTFTKSLTDLGKAFDTVRTSKDLEAYGNLFKDIRNGFSETSDRSKMPPRIFGIKMGVALDKALGSILGIGADGTSLNDSLTEARKRGIVSESLFNDLDGLRKFRNLCAHESIIPELSDKDRRRYIVAVESLEDTVRALEKSAEE